MHVLSTTTTRWGSLILIVETWSPMKCTLKLAKMTPIHIGQKSADP